MNAESALEFLRRGRPLAASLAPEREGTRAWVGVYPLDVQKPGTWVAMRSLGVDAAQARSDQMICRLRVIEVDESLLQADVWIGEDQLHLRTDMIVFGEEALMQALDRLGVARDALNLHYKVDYPV